MVYEKKCAECGDLLDFGGKDPDQLPENGIEFDGELYCKECVRKFVEFGTGDIIERINSIENSVKEIKDELGMEKTL